jgi:hypothetical protein
MRNDAAAIARYTRRTAARDHGECIVTPWIVRLYRGP